MQIRISRTKNFPIIVNQEELQKLSEFLSTNYSVLTIEAHCIDGSSLTTNKIDEIINFENSSLRKIKSITIVFGKPSSLGGSVNFGEDLFETCGLIVNEVDDSKALKIVHEIEFRLGECRTWYRWLMYIRPATLALVIPTLFFIVITWIEFVRNDYKLSTPNSNGLDAFYILFPLMIVFGVIVYIADRYWFWIFPKVWFDIGKQKAELQKRINVRNWLFGGIIATIILSIIGNLLTNLISK